MEWVATVDRMTRWLMVTCVLSMAYLGIGQLAWGKDQHPIRIYQVPPAKLVAFQAVLNADWYPCHVIKPHPVPTPAEIPTRCYLKILERMGRPDGSEAITVQGPEHLQADLERVLK